MADAADSKSAVLTGLWVRVPPSVLLKIIIDFVEEREAARSFGQSQLARAYGPNEPEYTTADLKPGSDS